MRAVAGAVGALLAGGVGVMWYGLVFEPDWIEVTRVKVRVASLPRAFVGLRLAHITDLHFGWFVGAAEARAAVEAVLALRPDLVAITGDLVSRLTEVEARIINDELSRLTAPLGVYVILGNHDHWTNAEGVAELIAGAGLTLLRNASAVIEQDGQALYVAGVDDVWERKADLSLALDGVPRDGRAILLAHEPDFADEAAKDRRVAVQLSGHSHGGQVRLPGRGAIRLPRLGRKYAYGLFTVGTMALYVNRGIGVAFPPIRLNCRPEVTLLELAPA